MKAHKEQKKLVISLCVDEIDILNDLLPSIIRIDKRIRKALFPSFMKNLMRIITIFIKMKISTYREKNQKL